jgi:SAM-dependent methyltransferase
MASPERPSPEPIFRVAQGFMAAKYLFAASDLGVFKGIPDAGCTLAELAWTTHVPPRTLRMVVDALVALGLLRGDGLGEAKRYRHTPETWEYLSQRTPSDISRFLRFWDQLSYRGWVDFTTSVRTGKVGIRGVAPTPEELRVLFEGVAAITEVAAESLAARYDFSRHRRLLDLGGGTGGFVEVIARRHPQLQGTLFDIAPEIARQRFAEVGLGSRFAVVEGDFFVDEIPGGHDVLLLSSIMHYYQPEQDIALLRRARQVSAPGTRILLVDYWLDAKRTSPLFNALMAGEFLVVDGGDSHGVDQAERWLAETGWRYESQISLEGPASALLAVAADELPSASPGAGDEAP